MRRSPRRSACPGGRVLAALKQNPCKECGFFFETCGVFTRREREARGNSLYYK
jgi:hypothetical protein